MDVFDKFINSTKLSVSILTLFHILFLLVLEKKWDSAICIWFCSYYYLLIRRGKDFFHIYFE